MLRAIFEAVIWIAPHSKVKLRLLRLLGHDIDVTARIGPIVVLGVRKIRLAVGSSIGPFNVFRNMQEVSLGSGSTIGQWNWVSAAPPIVRGPLGGRLIVGEQSAVTSRHYLDCSGGIKIGSFATVAGVRSTFITHGISWKENVQQVKPIVVGDYVIIGSNVSLAPGADVGDRTVVGMGSSVSMSDSVSGVLMLSPRAAVVKENMTGKYFERVRGYVD